jgi:hypothetical protein
MKKMELKQLINEVIKEITSDEHEYSITRDGELELRHGLGYYEARLSKYEVDKLLKFLKVNYKKIGIRKSKLKDTPSGTLITAGSTIIVNGEEIIISKIDAKKDYVFATDSESDIDYETDAAGVGCHWDGKNLVRN